jgi:LacI family transcriptional regulator
MTATLKAPKRQTTMRDVARAAGVSATTVSFVINDLAKGSIPEATRQRVWTEIARLDYRPNETARQLRTRRSHTIGFVTNGLIDSPFLGDLILGAQDAAWERHHLLTIATTDGDPSSEHAALDTLVSRRVDGVIFATLTHRIVTPPSVLRDLPAVLLNCTAPDLAFPAVVRDDREDGRRATEILLRKGHRRIGLIDRAPLEWQPGIKHRDRIAGYRDALTAFYAPFDERLIHHGDGTASDGYQAALNLLRLSQPPTALICGNEEQAIGVYDALRERRLMIPREVAVMAFVGQSAIAASLRPALSTMTLPLTDMGACAARLLTDHLTLGTPLGIGQHPIASTYVERGST